MLRRLLLIVLGLIVVLGGAAVAAVIAAPSFLTPRLEAALTQASGHPAAIRGGVSLGWNGGPELRVRDLVVANAPWGSRPDMLRAPLLTATLDASALVAGTVRIGDIRLQDMDLLLETDAAGHGNWERTAGPASVPTAPSTNPSAPAPSGMSPIQLGTIAATDGHVTYRDGKSGRVVRVLVTGTAQAAAEPVQVAASLHIDAAPMTADLRVEAAVDRRSPRDRSSLLLTGQLAVPEPIQVAAKLTPGQAGQTIGAEAHGAGLTASLAGVLDPATLRAVGPVTLDAALADGSPLPARLGVVSPGGAASLHVLLRQQGETITLRELHLTAPPGMVGAELDVGLTTPPWVHGSVTSPRIDLERLMALVAAPKPAPALVPTPAAPSAPPAAPAPAIPLEVLDRVNADLRLAVAELHDSRVTVRDLSGHLVLQNGQLALDPLVGTGPGGRLQLAIRADGHAAPPSLAVVLRAPALALQPFLTLAGLPGQVTGAAAIEADLHATGATQPLLLQSLAGRASVSMGDGEIDLASLSGLLEATHLPFDAKGTAHLRCLIARAQITGGVAQVDPLVIDATRLVVQGSGAVDLVHQTLALRLRPLLRTGPGLVVPMQLTGPWLKPHIDVDRGDLAGVVAGLTGQAGDACKAGGVTSSVAPPAPKPLKPAELLRSLLR